MATQTPPRSNATSAAGAPPPGTHRSADDPSVLIEDGYDF
jgi:hypothetical protein